MDAGDDVKKKTVSCGKGSKLEAPTRTASPGPEARPYQTEAYQAGIRGNTVVVMQTVTPLEHHYNTIVTPL